MPERSSLVVSAQHPDALSTARGALVAGGIVGIPTETVYGLAVAPEPAALEALIAAKRRPEEKGIALLVDDLDQVRDLVLVSAQAARVADALWPGPLTLVLPLAPGVDLPQSLTGGRTTLAVRIPDHPVPRALARLVGPMAVSSANRSGEPEARTAAELVASVGSALALVLDDGPVRGGVASSVIGFDTDGALMMLRTGALDRAEIEAALQSDG